MNLDVENKKCNIIECREVTLYTNFSFDSRMDKITIKDKANKKFSNVTVTIETHNYAQSCFLSSFRVQNISETVKLMVVSSFKTFFLILTYIRQNDLPRPNQKNVDNINL